MIEQKIFRNRTSNSIEYPYFIKDEEPILKERISFLLMTFDPFIQRIIKACDEDIYKYERRIKGHDATPWVQDGVDLIKYNMSECNKCIDQTQINIAYMTE